MTAAILHETARRLRLALQPGDDATAVRARLQRVPGVREVRANTRLRCVIVSHDGEAATRDAVLAQAQAQAQDATGAPRPTRRRDGGIAAGAMPWVPAALAAAVPVLPASLRASGALAAIATRIAAQPERLRSDPGAVLLDASSLAALALSGQPLVVSASVLLRWVAEALSSRLVGQADELLAQLLPLEAAQYQVLRDQVLRDQVLREPGDTAGPAWWPLRQVRAGDRLRLFAGDVVPVDGCVVDGQATLAPAALQAGTREVAPGDHVAAGERLQLGTLELRAEADPGGSRLARMRAHVRHAIGARDPVGRRALDFERIVSLPLTAAALVFGFTGDAARSASMLQADPQQGLDLALPLAREAALGALARRGLLASGLEPIERLAGARTLVLQDTGVLATGRWRIEAIDAAPGGDAQRVRAWLAALADTPPEVLDKASFPDPLVRQWVRHGAVLRVGAHDLHLSSGARLQRVWGLECEAGTATASGLQRVLAVVADGRVIARVTLASAWRPSVERRLRELRALGFERIAVFVENDGSGCPPPAPGAATRLAGVTEVTDEPGQRADWLAEAVSQGEPLVLVHTVLRDLLPPGSLSLTPMDADAGSHGVLLGDPLASLVAARRLARAVHRRLRRQQGASVTTNAALMLAGALRWAPPIATALAHHGFALLLLLDSMRLESLGAEEAGLSELASRSEPA